MFSSARENGFVPKNTPRGCVVKTNGTLVPFKVKLWSAAAHLATERRAFSRARYNCVKSQPHRARHGIPCRFADQTIHGYGNYSAGREWQAFTRRGALVHSAAEQRRNSENHDPANASSYQRDERSWLRWQVACGRPVGSRPASSEI
jgi:hypothetical protein